MLTLRCVLHHLPEISGGTEPQFLTAVNKLYRPLIIFLLPLSLFCFLVRAFWDQPPNKLLALKYLSQGWLLEEPTSRRFVLHSLGWSFPVSKTEAKSWTLFWGSSGWCQQRQEDWLWYLASGFLGIMLEVLSGHSGLLSTGYFHSRFQVWLFLKLRAKHSSTQGNSVGLAWRLHTKPSSVWVSVVSGYSRLNWTKFSGTFAKVQTKAIVHICNIHPGTLRNKIDKNIYLTEWKNALRKTRFSQQGSV